MSKKKHEAIGLADAATKSLYFESFVRKYEVTILATYQISEEWVSIMIPINDFEGFCKFISDTQKELEEVY